MPCPTPSHPHPVPSALAQLFDNRSVQALLASHIALLGAMPPRMLQQGQLSRHYFPDGMPSSRQTLVGKHEGRICRLHPTATSLEGLCERHGCSDPTFPEFIKSLLKMDPNERVSAREALNLPFITNPAPCPPYKLAPSDKSGEAGLRLLEKCVATRSHTLCTLRPTPWRALFSVQDHAHTP
jgi:serine/threonine protein kinase